MVDAARANPTICAQTFYCCGGGFDGGVEASGFASLEVVSKSPLPVLRAAVWNSGMRLGKLISKDCFRSFFTFQAKRH